MYLHGHLLGLSDRPVLQADPVRDWGICNDTKIDWGGVSTLVWDLR